MHNNWDQNKIIAHWILLEAKANIDSVYGFLKSWQQITSLKWLLVRKKSFDIEKWNSQTIPKDTSSRLLKTRNGTGIIDMIIMADISGIL